MRLRILGLLYLGCRNSGIYECSNKNSSILFPIFDIQHA